MSINILPNGVAVFGSTHHAEWCVEEGLVHDQFMARVIRENISKGQVLVNVGAHIGSLARVAIDQGARAICFEPTPDAVECLKHNLPELEMWGDAENYKHGCIVPVGLGEKHGVATLHQQENGGASYLISSEGLYGSVAILPLDAFYCGRVDLVLADCEGCELKFLKGAEKTITRHKPILILEVNREALKRQGNSEDELYGWLSAHGYDSQIIQPDTKAGDPQYDIIARPIAPSVVPDSDGECPSGVSVSREALVRDAIGILKQLATAPRYTAQVRKELKAQGVIK